MSARRWIANWVIPLLCCGVGACQRSNNGAGALQTGWVASPPATAVSIFKGTASCSGRSCHGDLEARQDREIGQHEYTKWLTDDVHANAFHLLSQPRSKDIAAKLNIKNAQESSLCLSCHMTPFAAPFAGDGKAASENADHHSLAKEETSFGVGCESCHGAAGKWLAAHTGPEWKKLDEVQKYREFRFVRFRSPADLAQTCVGCHVGAPPDKDNQLPLARDVNHDLIAAGHPRLNFELDVFLDNLPPHWNEEAKKKRDGNAIHVKTWLHGQLASAQAALELLDFRADENNGRPWPEFAEYDCFACHHDLQGGSWRQKPGYGAGRRLGTLPWGTWYFTMPRLLGEGLAAPDKNLRASLDDLEKSMGRTAPSRTEVVEHARTARDHVKKKRSSMTSWDSDRQAGQEWLSAFGRDERLTDNPSWDAAMQHYLARYSLDPSSQSALRKFEASLAIPNDFDRPQSLDKSGLMKLLKQSPIGEKP